MLHKSSGKIINFVNIYMPNSYIDKLSCWNYLLSLKDIVCEFNGIFVEGFNIIALSYDFSSIRSSSGSITPIP